MVIMYLTYKNKGNSFVIVFCHFPNSCWRPKANFLGDFLGNFWTANFPGKILGHFWRLKCFEGRKKKKRKKKTPLINY